MEKSWIVQKEERLDMFLRTVLPLALGQQISHSKIRRCIIAGCIFVDHKPCSIPSFVVKKKSCVKARIDTERFFFEKRPQDVDFVLEEKDVLFEDDFFLIVNKPAFLPSEPTIVESRKNMHQCAVDYVWRKNQALRNKPYLGIMHRLDYQTSGVLLFTKTRAVNEYVHKLFSLHEIKKVYRAVCCIPNEGIVKVGEHFFVEGAIARVSAKSAPCKMGFVPAGAGGDFSHTDFVVSAIKNELCYIDCFPTTGRTHQIRLHLSSRSLPICGDTLYGAQLKPAEPFKRIMLHAQSLAFLHPITKESLYVESPLPSGFAP